MLKFLLLNRHTHTNNLARFTLNTNTSDINTITNYRTNNVVVQFTGLYLSIGI